MGRARSSSLGCSAKEHGISASFAIDQAFLKSEPLASCVDVGERTVGERVAGRTKVRAVTSLFGM